LELRTGWAPFGLADKWFPPAVAVFGTVGSSG